LTSFSQMKDSAINFRFRFKPQEGVICLALYLFSNRLLNKDWHTWEVGEIAP
jgi:hypothetical protein